MCKALEITDHEIAPSEALVGLCFTGKAKIASGLQMISNAREKRSSSPI